MLPIRGSARKATEVSEASQEHAKLSSQSEKDGIEPLRESLMNPQSVVKILVGKTEAEFFVHKELLCRHSPYFAGALREGGFKEAATQSITLDHTDTHTFGLLVYWLYAHKVKVTYSTDQKGTVYERNDKEKPSWESLIDLWILADYLQVSPLQNEVIKLIHEKQVRLHMIPVTTKVYEGTPSGSMLQKIFTDFCVWRNCSLAVYDEQVVPDTALRNIVIGFAKKCMTPTPPNPLNDVRNYYVKTY